MEDKSSLENLYLIKKIKIKETNNYKEIEKLELSFLEYLSGIQVSIEIFGYTKVDFLF